MLRFAPSPTSHLDLTNLRIALLNYIVAKQKGEDFIVRIEDTQKEKNLDGQDQEILDILSLFGLHYSQIIHQSQNFKFHSAMALQLLHEKRAFSCFCSDHYLEKKEQEAVEANKEYLYDDACRNLPAELVIDNTNPFRVRIIAPNKDIVVDDLLKGEIVFTKETQESFTILHQDKTPTPDFAAAVDDMLNDISIIIRDETLLPHTPKQQHIREQLGYDKPITYAHIPPLHNGDISVKSLLQEGYLPEAILNYLISTLTTPPHELFTLQEAEEFFEITKINTSPASFDLAQLKEINKKTMQAMEAKELSRYVGFADEEIGELARVYIEDDICTTQELKAKIAPVFETRNIPQEFEKEVHILKEIILQAPHFEDYETFVKHLAQQSSLEQNKLEKGVRLLLTNTQEGPKMEKIYHCLKNYIGEIVK